MAKLKTIAKLVDNAAIDLQRLVRLKAADSEGLCECVTCGKRLPWDEMQGGHFISRAYIIHKLLEENIHPQCRRCNGPLKGHEIPYTLYMIDMYGREFVDHLNETKGDGKKYKRAEIEAIASSFKSRLTEIEKELGVEK